MSHFIFGTFDSNNFSEQNTLLISNKIEKTNIRVFFNQDIKFCNDLDRMLENNKCKDHYLFCITSANQELNSDDVLFPYDEYDEDELFQNGDDRSYFNHICEEHLKRLKSVFEQIVVILDAKNIKVFTVDGFDDYFIKSSVNIDGMIADMLEQVKTTFSLKSKIYEIQIS